MADTSLKNSKGWYCQGQQAIREQFDHNMWKYKCISDNTLFPCMGINMPMMTNGYNNNILSNNASDIESALFGIGSTNLVQPKKDTCGNMNQLKEVKFFKAKPDSNNTIPEPLVVHTDERYQIFRR